MAVISTSGTLVTITLGFVALATRAETYVLGAAVVVLLVLALVGLVLAAAAGLVVKPAHAAADGGRRELAELTRAGWDDNLGSEAVHPEHQVLAQLLTDLRHVNQRKARLLFAALLVEVTALAVMTVAVVVVLTPMIQ